MIAAAERAAAERSVIITLKLAADEQNKATAGLVASQAESVALAGKEGYDKLLKIAAETDNRINQVHAAQGKLRVDLDRQEVGERLRIVEDGVTPKAGPSMAYYTVILMWHWPLRWMPWKQPTSCRVAISSG